MSIRSRLFKLLFVGLSTSIVTAAYPVTASAATGSVGTTPASYTPWLLRSVHSQRVHRLVPCGNLMYAVGTISAIGQGGKTYTRYNTFSFSQTSGAVTSWAPRVNGPVNDVALSSDCSTVYLGGSFTNVNGTSVSNLVAVNATTGAVLTGFAHSAKGAVYTLDYTHGQLIVGGAFTSINGVSRSIIASLLPTTGAVTNYATLAIAGSGRRIENSQQSHSGAKLLIEGVFTTIAGQARRQVAVLDLGTSSLSLDSWYSPELAQACRFSYYARAAAWSPDDSKIYIATTGYKPVSGPGSKNSEPRAGLCDAAAAFSSAGGAQYSQWINYTGCDSYYGVVADSNNVYVTGHERWASNPYGCDRAGAGAVPRPGLAALNSSTGTVTSWNPTRSRGYGGDDMVLTSAGLWVASDNFKDGGAQMCGGQTNHGGICFLPY